MDDESAQREIHWEASEYLHHRKDATWFLLFGLFVVVLSGVIYVILDDVLSVVVIVLMAIALGLFANREPRILRYTLSDKGVTIGERKYSLDSFMSFSLMQEGAIASIQLEPSQRFVPPLTLYVATEDKDQIVSLLGGFLPYSERTPDIIDRLARKIRF